ncbi:HAD family hydrolase [Pararhizobium haloflavum]|uniref:HAD family hydrolase n=1 Tax=Pararhizobium haloflavum TaxID=2037914 RepID=UPI000C17B3C7|nr:HAD family phosphatase [Pararhizobium haloflavum]
MSSAIFIRHIVFDIGKVLIHYDPELPYRRLIPDEQERAWFLSNVCTHEWNLEQDRGRSWREAEDLLIAAHPGHEDRIRDFRRHWHEMVPHPIEGSVAIFERFIEEGHDVTMLTNFASDTFAEARRRFAFLNRARGVTVSGDIALIKPDLAIYEKHAADFDLEPDATLFIDDTAINVEGAKRAGWHALHFQNAETLKADLERFNLCT